MGGRGAFGSETWFRNGDGFSVDFQLLSRISPFGRRDDGTLVVRTPFSGLSICDPTPGTIAFVGVMLGSTFFDGFSRTSIWQNRYYNVQVDLLDRPSLADLVGQLMSLGGLLALRAPSSPSPSAWRPPERSRSPGGETSRGTSSTA